jgi:hypothetical protein
MEPTVVRKGATSSIIATVQASNARSIANIEGIGMKPVIRRPEWFHYDELVWHGYVIGTEWQYYYADIDTIVAALRMFAAVGLFDHVVRLSRIESKSGQTENFEFHLQLPDLRRAEGDLRQILENRTGVDLVAPPAEIVF